MSGRAHQTKALSLRQQEVLAYIGECLDRLGFPSTIAELQEAFGFASPNAIQTHLRALETKGYIRRHPGRSRALEMLAPSKLISLSKAAMERGKAEGYWEATGTGPMVFCALLYRRLKASLEVPGITLLSVTLWESDQNYAVNSEGRGTP